VSQNAAYPLAGFQLSAAVVKAPAKIRDLLLQGRNLRAAAGIAVNAGGVPRAARHVRILKGYKTNRRLT
jgi:hypothetical protein